MFHFKEQIVAELNQLATKGLLKSERILESPQGTEIMVSGKKVINFCSNNYLGLANDAQVITAAKKALEQWGYGLASVRFICGTQKIHQQLEKKLSRFLNLEETILYSSAFDANGGFFEVMAAADDVIISDALNHASIIDGIRLSKAERKIFQHLDYDDLAAKLADSQDKRRKIIATDGVFSMDGDIADLKTICDLAEKHQALVMVDDAHATGFMGERGRGTPEYCQAMDRVDIITGTLGKALGGGNGGFISGPKEIINLLRQRSRPYLFSNSLVPMITATSLEILNILEHSDDARHKLLDNTQYFRKKIAQLGFTIKGDNHPIVPVMLYDAKLAQQMAKDLLAEDIYVIGFSYPVVPEGQARIRVQISAAHTQEQLQTALTAFKKIGQKYQLIS